MPIPPFNEHGLLPAGLHVCTLGEAELMFCWNDYRRDLWRKLGAVLTEFRQRGFLFPLLIDGSFVTDKNIPGDVELVLDLAQADEEVSDQVILYAFHHSQRLHTEFNIDFYPNLPGSDSNFARFFQYLGEKSAAMKNLDSHCLKGILRVEDW